MPQRLRQAGTGVPSGLADAIPVTERDLQTAVARTDGCKARSVKTSDAFTCTIRPLHRPDKGRTLANVAEPPPRRRPNPPRGWPGTASAAMLRGFATGTRLMAIHYPRRNSRIKRVRKFGFRARMKTRLGRKMLNRKRRLGRRLTPFES